MFIKDTQAIRERILKVLKEYSKPVAGYQVALLSHTGYYTMKPILLQMEQEGLIVILSTTHSTYYGLKQDNVPVSPQISPSAISQALSSPNLNVGTAEGQYQYDTPGEE